MDARFVRVVSWPGVATAYASRRRAQFSSPYSKTLALLEREISHLGGRDVLIQTYHEKADIRIDGWPRANARVPSSPGVIVTFVKRGGQTLSFPCDRFMTWEDNLRAIALSLEALRTVDRYGVTKSAEQYRGFEALPRPTQHGPTTKSEAVEVLGRESGHGEAFIEFATPAELEAAIRDAQRATHPDKGGSAGRFEEVQQAAKILRGI